ncbi:hypothetical protein E2I00_018243, partial [Balaenoptera physalus]
GGATKRGKTGLDSTPYPVLGAGKGELLNWVWQNRCLHQLSRICPMVEVYPSLGPVAMGDMKTPDFDDLLAAFDIPDIDANEAIHSGPEENEGPGGSGKPEPSVGGESGEATAVAAGDGPGLPAQASDHGLPPPDVSAVSVIVKNTVCPEQSESLAGSSGGEGARAGGVTKEGSMGPRLMQNGFGGPEPSLPGTPHSPAPPSGGTWKEKSMEGKAPLDLFAHLGPEPGEHPDPLPPPAPSPPREGAMTPPPFSSPFELARENGPALLPPGSPPLLGALKQESCSPLHPQSLPGSGSGSSPEATGVPASVSPSRVAGVSFFKKSPGHQSPLASPKVPSCQPLKEEEDEGPVDKSPPGSPQSPSRGFLAEASLLKLSPATPTPEGPKVVSVQLGDGTRLKGTVLPVATIQNASTAMLMAASVARKAVSSLVEAFNKILNSKNLLPAYRPNLSPPAEAGLALPPTGYRCLDMRIEVTCNHCARRLVFFNKCSLLLHAREHKDKGLVMQCSHLVMRPVALDQMAPVLPLSAEPPAAPATSAYTCFRCLECKEQCRDKAGMATHFQQLGPPAPGATSNVCPTCPMMLPNRCSFSAHQRMHKNRPPHVCPECGGNFLQANFQTHLREACLHFSRRVGYRMIYKCAMCDTVFTHKPLLSSHFDQHLLPQRVSVFKCPSCPLLFAQKRTMLEHLKNTHQSGRSGEETPGKGAGGALLTPKTEPEELAVSRGGAAAPTEESSSSSEEEELPSSPEPPRPTKRPRRELGSKGVKGGVKKFPCRLCERSFCSAPSLRRHVRVNHEGIKRVYPCRYCTEGKRTFSSRLILEKHVQGPGRKRRQSSDSCSEEPDSTTPPAKSPRGGPAAGGHGPLRYRSGSSAEQSLMVGLRVDGGAQQCLDCGLCFASPGSLSRHRFISHKKKRGVGSASALGLGDGEEEAPPPSRSDPEGGDSPLPASGGPLTCKVCGKSCDSPLNLKTHFRTHGMAFIRARQGGSGEN